MVTSRAGRRLLARRSRSLPPPAREAAGSRGRARGAAGRGHGSPGGGDGDGCGGGLLPARHCPERSRPQDRPAGREREVGGESAGKGWGGKGREGEGRERRRPRPHPAHPHAGLGAGSWDARGSLSPGVPQAAQRPEEESNNFQKTRNSSLSGLVKAPELS